MVEVSESKVGAQIADPSCQDGQTVAVAVAVTKEEPRAKSITEY